jgi:oligosaccharyltransferase complex subunit beta
LSFESPKKSDLSLFHLGNRAYDHVLLLPPKGKAYGPNLTPNLLLDFLKADGNILLGLSGNSPVPSGIVSLLLELDIHLPADKSSIVVDHFNHDSSSSEAHDVVLASAPKPLRQDVKNYFASDKPIAVPRAVGQTLGASTPLLVPILRAPSTAYSTNPKDESVDELFASGQQLSLVSAHQARNSARLTVLGSVETLQDAWFNTKFGNKEFSKQLSGWTFKELGVIKVGRLEHHLSEAPGKDASNQTELNPKIYRIKNDVVCILFCSASLGAIIKPLTHPRRIKSSSPSMSTITTFLSIHPRKMLFNSSSLCSHLSIA